MLTEKLYNIGLWVSMPGVMMTEESESLTVRTLGIVSIYPLAPLFALGMILFILPATILEIFGDP